MENKAHAIAAGTFVLALLALLVALALWLTRDSGQRHWYDISTPKTISGLQPESAVRFRGVPVGKVESIGFDPQIPGNVLVRLAVERGTPMTRTTFATISTQGVTGLGFVQLDDPASASPPLAANDANPPRIPLQPGLLDKLITQSETILSQFEQASTSLSQLLSPDNQASVQAAVSQMGQAAGSVRQLAESLQPTVAALPALSRQSQQTLIAMQNAASGVSVTSDQLALAVQQLSQRDGAIDKISQGSAALANTIETFGTATLPRLGEVADETTRTMRQLRRTVNAVDDNPQALIFGSGPPVPGPGEAGFAVPQDQP